MLEQLQLALFEQQRIDPLKCEFVRPAFTAGGLNCCVKGGGVLVTGCTRSIAGEAPHCVHEPLDNSPEAVARRRAWIERNVNNG